MSNYATKSEKNALIHQILRVDTSDTCVDTSDFAKKADLATLKSDVNKLDIVKLEIVSRDWNSLKGKVYKLEVEKLVPVSVELSKLRDAVKIVFVKKSKYDELIDNFNDINTADTSDLVTKLTTTQKKMKLKRKLLVIIIVNISLLENLIS